MKTFTVEEFREWGREGGKATSKRKARSSQKNGKKGGRPLSAKTKVENVHDRGGQNEADTETESIPYLKR